MSQQVGIVIVSHSRKLATGLVDMIRQMVDESTPVLAVGGNPDGGLGTDADCLEAAVEKADRGHGVVVLGDLGSSILATRVIIEAHANPDLVLADAPLVEGSIAAAVTASTGATLAEVLAAAEGARDVRKF
ncbi:MAG: dihydroxyacetone kinase phosphoryl donor subunit DhaM [Nocardioides sp.]|uniref:dihydroxyacetone kinase phosphoryl donor subunit DhaM n=1 Tax=Nocardioides sp. TaxID=35761 RepID=UPI0039E3058B